MEEREIIKDIIELSSSEKFSNNIIGEYSPLVLAFIGDSVFQLYVRSYVISKGNMQPNKLHNLSCSFVNAKSQAKIIHEIFDNLTEEEQNITKRGRNAKSNSSPKNADIIDYRNATGFESLIGYLYLKKDVKRLEEILKLSTTIIERG